MDIDPLKFTDQGLYQCKKNDKVLRNVYVEVTSSASSYYFKWFFLIGLLFIVHIRT
jgi:hypothetical protein